MSLRVHVVIAAMVCWGCGERAIATDGSADSQPSGEQGLPDKGPQDSRPADQAALDLSPTDAGAAAAFIGSRTEILCEGVISVCKAQTAGCKLDSQHYLRGTFPGERKFLVTAASGKTIRISIYLREPKLSPGTETQLNWFEPGCTDEYKHNLSNTGKDLFKAAGNDDTIVDEQWVVENGDHLVTVWSDAVVKYLIRADVVN